MFRLVRLTQTPGAGRPRSALPVTTWRPKPRLRSARSVAAPGAPHYVPLGLIAAINWSSVLGTFNPPTLLQVHFTNPPLRFSVR